MTFLTRHWVLYIPLVVYGCSVDATGTLNTLWMLNGRYSVAEQLDIVWVL